VQGKEEGGGAKGEGEGREVGGLASWL